MKKKRNVIEEILAVKSRAEFDARYDYAARFAELDLTVRELEQTDHYVRKELLKYIPIASIACFEAFFSATVKELIDRGKPFADRLGKFNQAGNVKLDFEILTEIQGKTLTIGDFVAHMLSYNNLDDLNSNISTLINDDFLSALKEFKISSIFEEKMNTCKEFQARFDDIILSVKRTYEFRHIFCHEYSKSVKVDDDEILRNFSNCRIFLDQVNNFIWEILCPDGPETQADMNIAAAEKFDDLDNVLVKLIKAIKTTAAETGGMYHFDPDIFDKTMRSWKRYRQNYAECAASPVIGGSMYGSIFYSAMASKTKEKIESLENQYSLILR